MPEPLNPCPKCGEHVNPHILAVDPACPHGWEVATIADWKAFAAEEGFDSTVVPVGTETPDGG